MIIYANDLNVEGGERIVLGFVVVSGVGVVGSHLIFWWGFFFYFNYQTSKNKPIRKSVNKQMLREERLLKNYFSYG